MLFDNNNFAKQVLSLCLQNREFLLNFYSVLDEAYFRSASQKILLAVLVDFAKKYERCPKKSEIGIHIKTLYDSNNLPDALKNAAAKQDVYTLVKSVWSNLPDSDWVSDKLIPFIQHMEGIKFLNSHVDSFEESGKIDFNRMMVDMEKLADIGKVGEADFTEISKDIHILLDPKTREIVCPTFTPTLNDQSILDGGIARGEYFCFLSYPNVCKTTAMVALGHQARLNLRNVLHITLEDSKAEIYKKYVSAATGVQRHRLTPDMAASKAIQKHEELVDNKRLGKLFVVERDEYKLTPTGVYNLARKLEKVEGIKLDIVIIDYPQLLEPETKVEGEEGGQGNWKQIEDIHRAVKRVFRKLEVAGIGAIQAAEKDPRVKTLKLQNCGKAKAVGQVPDCLVSINELQKNENQDMEDVKFIFYIARNRVGNKYKTVMVKVDMTRLRMEEE